MVVTGLQPLVRDFGPSIRLQRIGADAALPDPRRVVVKEFRPDPALPGGPMVRGGRVRDPLRRSFESGHLTKRQWDGVEAFRDDVDLANGARLGRPDTAGVRTAPNNRNWPTDAQIDAWRRVARTMLSLPDAEQRLVTWTVIKYQPLTGFVREEGMRNETGTRMMQAVLDVLAARHWLRVNAAEPSKETAR